MPRLLIESVEALAVRYREHLIRQELRAQAERDRLLDQVATSIADGWLSAEAARARRRMSHANGQSRRVAADNQATLVRAYRRLRPWMEIHDAAETAADHGLKPEDLRNKTSGKRKRRKSPGKAQGQFAFRYLLG